VCYSKKLCNFCHFLFTYRAKAAYRVTNFFVFAAIHFNMSVGVLLVGEVLPYKVLGLGRSGGNRAQIFNLAQMPIEFQMLN